MRVPYTWLLDYVKTDTPPDELAHILTMGGLEVEEIDDWTSEDGQASDKVLITSVTSNRGDLLSMVGVARHAAALLDCEFEMPDLSRPEIESPIVGEPLVECEGIKVEVIDFEGCPRYSALVIRDIEMRESPEWMRRHLEAAGIRPISNVVDATNYVCWELGQPMHAFDLRLVARDHIIVRKAAAERLTLIDDTTVDLTEKDLVICDEMGPVALAGVMGGLDTQIRERSNAVLLESAHFDPTTIRRTAQRHGAGSESSYRFERHVDPNLTLPAIARATELILASAGGTPDAVAIDVRQQAFEAHEVSLRPERCNALLGTAISPEEMAACLSRLGLEVEAGERIQVRVPTFRSDIEREVDLIEEVAIVHGYNNIPLTVPGKLTESGLLTPQQRAERRTRELLRECGLNETIGFSFMGQSDLDRCGFPADAPERNALGLLLPVAADMSHLRTTLIPGLLNACAVNVRQRVLDIAIYELDRVFLPQGEGQLPAERMRVGGAMMGAPLMSSWNLPDESATADFYWLKGIVEQLCDGLNVADVQFVRGSHPTLHEGRCAELTVGGATAGFLGEVAPGVQEAYDLPANTYLFELDWEALVANARPHREHDPLPRFPAALRDIAFVVPDDEEHAAAAIAGAIREVGGEALWKAEAFDLYADADRLGSGMKSLAFRLTFRAPDRTLTDAELDGAMSGIAEHLAAKLGAEIRDK